MKNERQKTIEKQKSMLFSIYTPLTNRSQSVRLLFVTRTKVIREDSYFWSLIFSSSPNMLFHRLCLLEAADHPQNLSCDKAFPLHLTAARNSIPF